MEIHTHIHTQWKETHYGVADIDWWHQNNKAFKLPAAPLQPPRDRAETCRVQGCQQLIDFKWKCGRQQVYQMAQKMSNKCHSICGSAQCFTRLMDVCAAKLIASALFFSRCLFLISRKRVRNQSFPTNPRLSFFNMQDSAGQEHVGKTYVENSRFCQRWLMHARWCKRWDVFSTVPNLATEHS